MSAQPLPRYPNPTVKLDARHGLAKLTSQIRSEVAEQGDLATFRIYGRRQRTLALELAEALRGDFDVMVFTPDKTQTSARHRDWMHRWVTELRVCALDHPDVAERKPAPNPMESLRRYEAKRQVPPD